jgi:hypothetical protein
LSKQLPGIVFARGGAVGILMLLECNNIKYAVLTEQVNAKPVAFRHVLIWNKNSSNLISGLLLLL